MLSLNASAMRPALGRTFGLPIRQRTAVATKTPTVGLATSASRDACVAANAETM